MIEAEGDDGRRAVGFGLYIHLSLVEDRGGVHDIDLVFQFVAS